MRKITCLMLAAILLLAMPAAAAETDAEHVRGLIAQLATVEQYHTMNSEEQLEAYNLTQTAYDAYMALSDGEKQKLEGAEEQFEALFTYFILFLD